MAVKSKQQLIRPLTIGDFIIWDVDNIFTRVSALIENDATVGAAGSTTATEFVGLPLILNSGVWEFAVDASTISGFIIRGRAEIVATAAFTVDEQVIITQGPANVNQDRFAKNDAYGTALTEATMVTAAALLSIKSIPLGTKRNVQLT